MDFLILLGLKTIIHFFSFFDEKVKEKENKNIDNETAAAFWFGTSYENMESGGIENQTSQSEYDQTW